jgi:hypothetical protein
MDGKNPAIDIYLGAQYLQVKQELGGERESCSTQTASLR